MSSSGEFDKAYWEQHWEAGRAGEDAAPANPHLVREVGALSPGTALDAGCGEGGEARWLAAHGWQVTAVDISAEALARAVAREPADGGAGRVDWVEADLTTWVPDRQYDLVATSYAHPTIPQLDFYDRIAAWVKPGGSLLVVGHLHRADAQARHGNTHGHMHGHTHGPTHGHEHLHGGDGAETDGPPAHATVALADLTARLDPAEWDVQTASEHTRTAAHGSTLQDVVVRARRRGQGRWERQER